MTYKLYNILNSPYDEIVYERMHEKSVDGSRKSMSKKYIEVLEFIDNAKEEKNIKNLRKKILEKIGEKHYISWFKDNPLTVWGSSYYLNVSNDFIKDMCVSRFNKLLRELNIYVGTK